MSDSRTTWLKRMSRRFFVKDGVHPPAQKQTETMKIFPGPRPEEVMIPLLQSVGEPCEPIVEPGQKVFLGQKIGDSEASISAPIHASVSGEVVEVLKFPHPEGRGLPAIKIKNDKLDTPCPDLEPAEDPLRLSPEEVRRRVREAGIVGLGGAAFPTHVKLGPPDDKPIDTVILNGSECEPYLSGDYRTMMEKPEAVILGGLVIKKTVGADRLIVGVEHNRAEAIDKMREAGKPYDVDVLQLPCRYPTGAEKTLIRNITGLEVPSGGLPMDVGIIVSNVGTARQIYESLSTGMPLVERVLTVAGDGVAGWANLSVKIGTKVKEVIDYCGGFVGEYGKVIIGGPMMGVAQYTYDIPVIKSTTGIIVLRGETLFRQEAPHFVCIRCGRCVRRCPMNLTPYLIGAYSDKGMWDELEPLNIGDCMECGACTYVCPTKNPLVQLIKVGKGGLSHRQERIKMLASGNGAGAETDDEDDEADETEETEEHANA